MKNVITKRHTNRKMNPDTYKLRREVINIIYQAKNLLKGNMERVDVRITDCSDERVLGTARMNGKMIWIPASSVKESKLRLRHIVLHELLHTLYGIGHIEKCRLMSSTIKNTTTRQQDHLFLGHVGIR